MSVYAQNLLRELVALGHEVTMISQYRGDEAGTRVYGGGPPAAWCPACGSSVSKPWASRSNPGRQFRARHRDDGANRRGRTRAALPSIFCMRNMVIRPDWRPWKRPNGLALPNVVSIQGGDGHWVGVNCCETHREAMRTVVLNHAVALLIGSRSFAEEVHENHGTPTRTFHDCARCAVDAPRFSSPRQMADRRLARPGATGHPLSRTGGPAKRGARFVRCVRHVAPSWASRWPGTLGCFTLALARIPPP